MRKFSHKNKYLCLGIAALLGSQIVAIGEEAFQNNLLKMDINKTSLGGVKVTLYTTKPYKDAVVVNKKNDQEYVIYMPETASTMTSTPTVKSASDVLSKVEVKTQQYGTNQGRKGYTKITISSLKPVEITPQVQTVNVSGYKISEQEAKELIEHAGKKPAAAKTVHPAAKVAQKAINPQIKPALQPPVKKEGQTALQKVVQTVTPAKKITTAQKPAVAEQPKPDAEKKVTTTIETPVAPETTNVTDVAEVKKQTTNVQAPQENLPTKVEQTPIDPKKEFWMSIGQNFVDNQTLNVLISLIPLISGLLILLVDRKQKNAKTNGTAGKASNPKVKKVSETVVDEEMNWKEKFKAYKSAEKPATPLEEYPSQNGETLFEQTEPINWELEEEEEKGLDIEELFIPKDITEEVAEADYEPETELETQPEEEIQGEEDALWDEFIGPEPTKETSVEDIFGEKEENEQTKEQIGEDWGVYEVPEDFVPEEYTQSQIEELLEETESAVVEEESEEFSFEKAFESLEPTQEYKEEPTFEFEEHIPETEELSEVPEVPGLATKSSHQIDGTKGFHLVDFEGTTALIGYIYDEIYVLKRFDAPVKGKLQARLSEQKDGVATFIVRADGEKSLIEVTPDNMRFLLEL